MDQSMDKVAILFLMFVVWCILNVFEGKIEIILMKFFKKIEKL